MRNLLLSLLVLAGEPIFDGSRPYVGVTPPDVVTDVVPMQAEPDTAHCSRGPDDPWDAFCALLQSPLPVPPDEVSPSYGDGREGLKGK